MLLVPEPELVIWFLSLRVFCFLYRRLASPRVCAWERSRSIARARPCVSSALACFSPGSCLGTQPRVSSRQARVPDKLPARRHHRQTRRRRRRRPLLATGSAPIGRCWPRHLLRAGGNCGSWPSAEAMALSGSTCWSSSNRTTSASGGHAEEDLPRDTGDHVEVWPPFPKRSIARAPAPVRGPAHGPACRGGSVAASPQSAPVRAGPSRRLTRRQLSPRRRDRPARSRRRRRS